MKPLHHILRSRLLPATVCASVFLVQPLHAQMDTPPAEAPASPAPASAALTDADRIPFIDYQDTDIRTIILEVAELYELNISVPETLTGSTSIKLRNVTWRDLFDLVLGQVDFTYVEQNGIVRIVSRASLQTEPVRTEVILLQFAKASELAEIVTPMLNTASGESIRIDPRTNAIVLTAGQTRSTEIRSILARLDEEPGEVKQVFIDSKFVEMTANDGINFGLNFRGARGRWGSDSGNVPFLNYAGTGESGLDAALGTPAGAAFADGLTAVYNSAQFRTILQALSSSNKTQVISNPTIVTFTNEEARIGVIQKFPILRSTTVTGSGPATTTVELDQEVETGIILRVTPQVRPQGLISMTLTPEVSVISGFNSEAGFRPGNQPPPAAAAYPVIDSRNITTRVNIRDGYTIALGGLVRSQTSKGRSGIPVLGQLPGVGALFRNTSDSVENTNLIVFITARVVDPTGRTQQAANQDNFDTLLQDTVDPRVIREMGLERFNVPGFRPDLPTFPTEDEKAALEEAERLEREARRASAPARPAGTRFQKR